jgi:small subunit ribosomal protein S29
MPLVFSAGFSTTPRASLAAKKGSNAQALHNLPSKGKKSLNIKKAAPERKTRIPPDQKRALQKRIVLSNTNAQQVVWLRDLSKENMSKEGVKGKVYGLPEAVVDALRLVKAFKVGQDWAAYRRPACLIRHEAWELGKMMEGISRHQFGDNQAAGSAQTVKRVIYGPRLAGKSVLMLQVMAMAFLRGWIVINIPEGKLN